MKEEELALLKSEKKFGHAASLLVASFVALAAIALILLNYISVNILIGLLVLALALGYLVNVMINRKINLDLKNHEIVISEEQVIQKDITQDVEPGSGALYIPILGRICPKLWGQKMKDIKRMMVYTSNGKYEISPSLYKKVKIGDLIKCNYSKEAGVFLGVK